MPCSASRRLRHTSTPSIWCGRMVSLGWTAHMVPLTVDGLIYASSIVVLDSARREAPVSGAGAMAAWPGHCGAARGQRGPWGGHRPVGAAVAAWPAVAPVGSYKLLMMVIRGSQAVSDGVSGSADNPDPLGEQAAGIFAGQLTADRVPSVRAIRAAASWPALGAAATGLPCCRSREPGGSPAA